MVVYVYALASKELAKKYFVARIALATHPPMNFCSANNSISLIVYKRCACALSELKRELRPCSIVVLIGP